jgi:tetratricopeptide (TPR) repeat protein
MRKGDEAVECATRALDLNPTLTGAERLRARASFAAVVGERPEGNIERAIRRTPNSGFPHALMASHLQEKGDFVAAEHSLMRSLELEPRQGLAYYLLAHNRKVRESERALYEGIEPLSKQKDLDSAQIQYLNFALGKAFDDLREYEKAIRYLDLANNESDGAENVAPTPDSVRHAWRSRRYIELFTPEFMEQFRELGLESAEPIFIFGMPRSGTTLLEQILSRHSNVGAAGEQSFWRNSGRRILSLEKGRLHPDELQRAGHRYLARIRSISPGSAHVTDKFPSNFVYLGLLDLVFPNARFIHARRHPLDTCLSMYMRPFYDIQEAGHTRQRIVDSYRLYRESMVHWRRALKPGRFLEVDYEELVTHPEPVTRRVIDYCGLEWEDACLHPEQGERRVITFSKWQVRQPVYTTSVERWRNYEPWLGVFKELLD